MVKKIIQKVQKKRKREGKTNYKKRLKLLLSNKLRLVIRPSLKSMNAQIIEYHPNGDRVIVSFNARELEKIGWKLNKGNIPSAYLTGLSLGKKAKDAGVKEAILDVGLTAPSKGSRIYACLKGVIDAGLNIPFSKEILPSEDRIKGEHISKYAGLAKERFSGYAKQGIDASKITKLFEDIKNKIVKVK